MSESTISNNLKSLIKLYGDLSLSDIARETKIPQPTLHHILDGTTKKPRRNALEALAQFFKVSVLQLTGSIPLAPVIPDAIKSSLSISTVPLVDWSRLKNWITQDKKQSIEPLKEIILEKKVGEESFGLVMKDSTMEPLFPENSILVFDSDKKPQDRDFVLVYIESEDLFIFNRLIIDGRDFFIRQDQLDGKTQFLKLKNLIDKIIGTLSEVRIQF